MNSLLEMVAATESQPVGSVACSCGGETEDVKLSQTVYLQDDRSFKVDVPALRCSICGEAYTDERAEKIRHEAACRFEKLLTPGEIRAVRERLKMSRKQFDEAFGFAPASMERWENGRLMQSRSADTLLRALSYPAVALALDRREGPAFLLSESNVIHVAFERLVAQPQDVQADTLRRQLAFQLRRAG